MALFHHEWNRKVAQELTAAGQALGLAPADYRHDVASAWQMQPLAGKHPRMPVFHSGCVAGRWKGRLVSATVMLPVDQPAYGPGPFVHVPDTWSEGQLLVTSVGFIGQVVPFMIGAPNRPHVINEHKTYHWYDWFPGFGVHEFGTRLAVPGDTGDAWVVRAIQTERPAAVLAAIAPTLLGEEPYPWRIDGGKEGKPIVDLVRVDVRAPDSPTPDAALLATRFGHLVELASLIEKTLADLPRT